MPDGQSPGIIKPMAETWKTRVQRALEDAGLTMKAASLAAGKGETFIRDMLKRDREPGIESFAAVASVLRKSVDELWFGLPPSVDSDGLRAVPLISWVSAGKLADPGSQVRPEDFPSILVPDLAPGDYFATKVAGDSMDRYSPEGSTIIVNRRERRLFDGKPYVFYIDGQATYKLWRPKPARLAPYSTNPANEPIFVERQREMEVVGRVKRTVLDL